jgi:GrpB-like predicted nucleotidyltransferase (UPF0157 family)
MSEPEYLVPREPAPQVFLADHDEAWAGQYAAEESSIRTVLGPTLVSIHHAGSTAVPGLPAKPVIDIVLTVQDPTDESSYVHPLEAAGYTFHHREPDWHQHRLLKRGTPHLPYDQPRDQPRVNLHVFPEGCDEVRRMLAFRDWLVRDEADRRLYARTKRELAGRPWETVQDYADAKTQVVAEIMERAIERALRAEGQPSNGEGSPAPTRTTSG